MSNSSVNTAETADPLPERPGPAPGPPHRPTKPPKRPPPSQPYRPAPRPVLPVQNAPSKELRDVITEQPRTESPKPPQMEEAPENLDNAKGEKQPIIRSQPKTTKPPLKKKRVKKESERNCCCFCCQTLCYEVCTQFQTQLL